MKQQSTITVEDIQDFWQRTHQGTRYLDDLCLCTGGVCGVAGLRDDAKSVRLGDLIAATDADIVGEPLPDDVATIWAQMAREWLA